jgi:transglutaminase-like putative cysteine protease
MSGSFATRVALPHPLRGASPSGGGPSRRAISSRGLDPLILRLIAFAGIAAYGAATWVGLVSDPPTGRTALAVLAVLAGAAGLAWLSRGGLPRAPASGLALVVAVATTASAAIAMGLPARLIAPPHWGELGGDLGGGFRSIGGLDYPYGGGEWSRLTLLLGLPLWLGIAGALTFWPARRGGALRRTLALILIVAAYTVAVTVSPPGAPVVHGLVLLLLVAAWLWLPVLGRRDALAATGLVLSAGALALPAAAQLDGQHPWLDYRNWDWTWSAVDRGESFSWDHSYGPIDWPRTGQTLLEVKSDVPHYWRSVVLDRFDGYRWLESTASGNGGVELPRSPSGSPFTPQTVRLDPDWIHRITFTVRGLRSQLVVGAGMPLAIRGLDGVARMLSGLALPADQGLSDGVTYTMRAYIPDPSARQMRSSPLRYPDALAPYTALVVPRTRTGAHGANATAAGQSASLTRFRELNVPMWGPRTTARTPRAISHSESAAAAISPAAAARVLSTSAYDRVYRLANRLTSGARTPYDAVQAVEKYLRSSYTYSEIPPRRQLPLQAFLFKDGIGYCQQFSGAMALMLRMVGIPARIASGFSPGTPTGNDTYVVQDFDAHSWVEVYFNGIGWVPFDPTPAAAPAQSQITGLGNHFPSAPAGADPAPKRNDGSLSLRRAGGATGHPNCGARVTQPLARSLQRHRRPASRAHPSARAAWLPGPPRRHAGRARAPASNRRRAGGGRVRREAAGSAVRARSPWPTHSRRAPRAASRAGRRARGARAFARAARDPPGGSRDDQASGRPGFQ